MDVAADSLARLFCFSSLLPLFFFFFCGRMRESFVCRSSRLIPKRRQQHGRKSDEGPDRNLQIQTTEHSPFFPSSLSTIPILVSMRPSVSHKGLPPRRWFRGEARGGLRCSSRAQALSSLVLPQCHHSSLTHVGQKGKEISLSRLPLG